MKLKELEPKTLENHKERLTYLLDMYKYYHDVMYSFKSICQTVLLANAYLTDIDNELLADYNYTEEDLFELFV
ncbi:hypothetical protein C6A33_01260 [Streptococcus anginosus]|uniref:hypothetical protein n=1 Tax=Streptococcus anginosus TaxID=1328 RepID=UPI000D028427|nr:hypothetical protein [Streptococcus anginosus]PRT63901.1 hypothetical protein C6A33_01260 [Streptococcus anginosus]